MTQLQYEKLAADLQVLARIIPLNWGRIQNDGTDRQINMFQIHSYEDLERHISFLPESSKNYFRRRWFLWKAAQCDEYIFCMNNNVSPNPNFKDQSYDIEFNNDSSLRFDVKGTVVPRDFRINIKEVIKNPSGMIKFFYEEQSKGVRQFHQNRLFLVHHSYKAQEREMYLRCHWEFKKIVYREYARRISLNAKFFEYENTKSDVVFIFENLDGTISHSFFAVTV
jgi:hypothetical protein